MKKNNNRIESDSLGKVKVPKNALYGAQTQRAFENFQVSDIKIPRPMIASIAMIKRSAAIVNRKLGFFDSRIKDAIVCACDVSLPIAIFSSPVV